jgi:hypothetical protein
MMSGSGPIRTGTGADGAADERSGELILSWFMRLSCGALNSEWMNRGDV